MNSENKKKNKHFDSSPFFSYHPQKDLNHSLYNHISYHVPDRHDFENTTHIVKCLHHLFEDIKHKMLKKGILLESSHIFGSQLNGLAIKSSDIDMTILTSYDDSNYVAKILYKTLAGQDEQYFRRFGFTYKIMCKLAYHPIIDMYFLRCGDIQTFKYYTNKSRALDLTINGQVSIRNSLIIKHIAQMSSTFRNLVILIKIWVMRFPRHKRLNLYTYYILAIHFLQHQVHPPLIPPVDLGLLSTAPLETFANETKFPTPFDTSTLKDEPNSPKISTLLEEFFRYYGLEYHLKDERPKIWIETTQGGSWNGLLRDMNLLQEMVEVEDPFEETYPGANLLGSHGGGMSHVDEMKAAAIDLGKGKNILSEKYLDEKREERNRNREFWKIGSEEQREKIRKERKLKKQEQRMRLMEEINKRRMERKREKEKEKEKEKEARIEGNEFIEEEQSKEEQENSWENKEVGKNTAEFEEPDEILKNEKKEMRRLKREQRKEARKLKRKEREDRRMARGELNWEWMEQGAVKGGEEEVDELPDFVLEKSKVKEELKMDKISIALEKLNKNVAKQEKEIVWKKIVEPKEEMGWGGISKSIEKVMDNKVFKTFNIQKKTIKITEVDAAVETVFESFEEEIGKGIIDMDKSKHKDLRTEEEGKNTLDQEHMKKLKEDIGWEDMSASFELVMSDLAKRSLKPEKVKEKLTWEKLFNDMEEANKYSNKQKRFGKGKDKMADKAEKTWWNAAGKSSFFRGNTENGAKFRRMQNVPKKEFSTFLQFRKVQAAGKVLSLIRMLPK